MKEGAQDHKCDSNTMNMENKRTIPFVPYIIALIIGRALYGEFDVETMRFENTALAIVYMVGFGMALYLIVKGRMGRTK